MNILEFHKFLFVYFILSYFYSWSNSQWYLDENTEWRDGMTRLRNGFHSHSSHLTHPNTGVGKKWNFFPPSFALHQNNLMWDNRATYIEEEGNWMKTEKQNRWEILGKARGERQNMKFKITTSTRRKDKSLSHRANFKKTWGLGKLYT